MSPSKIAGTSSRRLTKNIEWYVISAYWILSSIIVTANCAYEEDLVTRWLVVVLGAVPFAQGLRAGSIDPLTNVIRVKLRWSAILIIFLFFANIPLIILETDFGNCVKFAESQIIVGAPMFGLSYHFLSVANTIIPHGLKMRHTTRTRMLLAAANRYIEGATCISLAAVLLFIFGLLLRSSLIPQSSLFSVFLLKMLSILTANSLFIYGFFRASKLSKWYAI